MLNGGAFVILIHLWQRVAVAVQVGGDGVPPNWEVFFQRSAEVGAMWSWLTHEVVKHFAWPLPGGSLHTQERSNGQSWRQSEHPAMSSTSHDRSHERIAERPANNRMRNELT